MKRYCRSSNSTIYQCLEYSLIVELNTVANLSIMITSYIWRLMTSITPKSDVAADQWYMRTLPQDNIERVLSDHTPQETIQLIGRPTERTGRMDELLQQ